MDVSKGYSGSDVMSLLDISSNSLWVPSSPSPFHESMMKFDQDTNQGRRQSGGASSEGEDWGGEELEMMGLHKREKKRRLRQEQVEFLEKSFEVENKLEPERKVELAKELGLQPRQVAVWFQNRRARYKTKQLEKDYGSLKTSYDSLKLHFDSLIKERDHLQNEVKLLKQIETGQENPNPGTPLNSEPKTEPQKEPTKIKTPIMVATKQGDQDASSIKSDVFDSESPHCTEGIHSSMLEDPTQLPDPDMHSDFSQNEEGRHLSLLLPITNNTNNNNELKVEEEFYYGATNSCNFSFGTDEQHVWSWLY